MSTPGKYVILMHLHLNDSITFKDLENILWGNILFEDLNTQIFLNSQKIRHYN